MAASLNAVGAILVKDLRLLARDRFYLFVSILGLVAYAALFWVLPAAVEETVPLGVHLPGSEALLEAGLAEGREQGLAIVVYASSDALEQAVAEGEDVLAGDAPDELRDALAGMVREVAHQLAGNEPPVTLPPLEEMVLGVDRAGDAVTLREELRPLLIFLVLMVEMFALASLVAVEIAQRTAAAVLATPARVGDLLAAKALLGTALAFSQALLLALVTGALAHSPGLILVALLFPGTPAPWVQALATYGLAETLLRSTAHRESWAQLWPYLGVLAGWCVAAFAAGTVVLGRRHVGA